ncbi:MAG: MCE family protein [Deferribacteraceae bacterium]|jgi:phospholipid/cholesterol/gamma-HCH transport system substrate-binding protein|nr:MCE family protein [Deferribacteraceae bacterium]
MTREIKVGIFLVGGIALALVLSTIFGNLRLFSSGGMKVTFFVDDSSGITINSKVKYRGVTVGEVVDVELENGKVAVRVYIKDQYKIPDNVTVMISQDGLIGEKYIDLNTKSHSPAAGNLADGGEYSNYKSTVTIDDLAEKVQEIASQVNILVSSLNNVFSSEQGKDDMSTTLHNLRVSSDSIRNILTSNQDEIKSAISNLNKMSYSMNKFSSDLERIMSAENSNIQASIQNLKEITQESKTLIDNINKITQEAYDGKGTIGMLLSDNETRDQIKDTVSSLKNMLTRADQLVLKLEAGIEYMPSNDNYHGSFMAKLQPSDKRYYMFGVSNRLYNTSSSSTIYTVSDYLDPAGNKYYSEEKNKTEENVIAFSLQYALLFGKYLGVRGGLFENQIGFGIDLYPFGAENLALTFETSDFFRRDGGIYLKANAKYYFLNNFFIQAGLDDFGSGRSSFSFGGGIHFIDDDLKYIIGSMPISSVAK